MGDWNFTDTFFWIYTAILLYFFFSLAVFAIGIFRLPRKKVMSEQALPFISVVVAARNEEKNIARTLDALVQLDYPHDRFEIIICDGMSEDNTASIVSAYSARHPFVKLCRATPSPKLRGKANALHQAISMARGEFILITDADCRVEPTWAKETVSYFTADVGVVCGITIPKNINPSEVSQFTLAQALDWCMILGVSSGRAALGFPIGGIGNNFSIRKQTYQDIGGYENLKFSVTEDFTLFQAAVNSAWEVVFPLRYETRVLTEPMPTVSELYQQKKRWTVGAQDASLIQALFASHLFLTHLVAVLGFFFLPLPTALGGLALKLVADLFVIVAVLVKLRELRKLIAFPVYELFYFGYVLAFPFILLFSRHIVWKGIDYRVSAIKR
jgi:1,2-diacylglycerol 3-beta-glucosyltransferase